MKKSILDLSKKELVTDIKIPDLNGNAIVIHPKALLTISPAQLSKDIQDMSTISFTLQRAKDLAELEYNDLKQTLKRVSDQLYTKYINDPDLRKKNGGRKPTDALVRSKIGTTQDYFALKLQLNHKLYIFQILKDLSYDLQEKSDLLQTESSNLRAQRQIRDNNV